MDEAIVAYIKRKYNLLIGERTAELIKKQIGNAYAVDEVMTMEIKGRDLVAGVPKTLIMNSDEIREALAEPVNQIVEAVRSRWSGRRPSWRPTSSTRASCSPAAARCCATSTSCLREETGLPVMVSRLARVRRRARHRAGPGRAEPAAGKSRCSKFRRDAFRSVVVLSE